MEEKDYIATQTVSFCKVAAQLIAECVAMSTDERRREQLKRAYVAIVEEQRQSMADIGQLQ